MTALAVAAAILIVTGCASPEPQISIEGPYANLSGMFVGVGSVFMTIRNAGGRDKLVFASADLPATTVELHDVKNNKMVPVEHVVIPSRDTVQLRPRGRHIMIFNLPRTVREGSVITMTLRFERSGAKQVRVRFEPPAGTNI